MYVRPRVVYKVVNTRQDYVDACERLAQLNLTEVQQREVVRVVVNCCGNVGIIHLVIPKIVSDTNFSTIGKGL
jgi:MA3 domain